MANLTETAQWEAGIYRLETTDPVLGGENGPSNAAAKQLANRTLYLKGLVDAIGGNYATQAFVNSAVAALVDGAPGALNTLNELAAALGDDPNFAATITAALAGKQPLDATLSALASLITSSDKLIYATGADSFALASLTAYGRSLIAAASASAAKATLGVVDAPVGSIIIMPGTTAPSGYIKANGALLSRATYADLWAYASASGNMAANDGAWQDGQFSPGDGSTNFRIPDWRGNHLRAWDDARGVDAGRGIGSVQLDAIKSHTHPFDYAAGNWNIGNASPFSTVNANRDIYGPGTTGAAGASENRVRTIAQLVCIKF